MRWHIAGLRLIAAALGLVGALKCPAVRGQSAPAAEAADGPRRSAQLAQRDRLWDEAKRCRDAGDYAAAIAAARQMVAIETQLFGEFDSDVAFSYGWIGDQQFAAADYDAAAASYGKRVEVLAALDDAKPWDLVDARQAATDARLWAGLDAEARRKLAEADALHGQVIAKYQAGDYPAATALAEQVLAIRRDLLGEHHPETATSLNNLALLYESTDEYDRALPLYEQALAIRKQVQGDDHPETAASLNNLACLYESLGEDRRALPLFEQALAIRKQALGDDHPNTAISLSNLASLYQSMGENDRALPLYKQALAIRKNKLGENHPDTAFSLNNLAYLYQSKGECDRALPLYQQALAIRKQTLGNDHPDTAASLNNLADLYQSTGEYDRALPLYEQSLSIVQQALGGDHRDTATALNNLASVYAAMGNSSRARELLAAAAAAERKSLERELYTFGDARIRSLLAKAPPSVDALASLASGEAGQADQLLDVLVNTKAIAFDVLNLRRAAVDLAAADEEAAQLQRDLATAQQALESLALRPPPGGTPDEIVQQRAALQEDIRRLDERLSRKLATFLGNDASLAVTVDQLRAAMAPGRAHVECFCYRPFDYRATGVVLRRLPARYAAIALAPDADRPVQFVDLGPAADIDALVDQLAQHVANYSRLVGRVADEVELEDDYRAISAALWGKLFAPLADALGDARQITLGLDGRLHELAFEALVDDAGRYLIESGYQFAYVNSGRDLLRHHGELGSGVAVFACPDYSSTYRQRLALANQLTAEASTLLAQFEPDASAAATVSALDAPPSRAATRLGWRDLGEAALAEGREAAAALDGAGFGPVATFSRGSALEDLVKRLVSPRVLVLITHGDFLTNEPAAATETSSGRSFSLTTDDRGGAGQARAGLRAVADPFLRSYLVLAGANAIDERVPANVCVENGWLTAREIARLDLRGTDLVVLSACSTNRGDANNGQAVMGMRSAFLFAGARTVVGSLFEVPNAQTRQLLKPFYEGVAAGQGKLTALNAAKLQFLRERRDNEGASHPFYWASFILVGEP
jgi:CHAT domain-containing protein